MKFKIDNYEVEDYQLSNNDIKTLLESGSLTDEENEFLRNRALERFFYDSCKREGETNDELFGRQFGDFVNGKMRDADAVAEKMSKEHRYLQSEMFKVCLAYIKKLAENYDKGFYDPRNEWASVTSKKMLSAL